MNTNPNAINILCFGDSNTYGQKPDKTGRYEANVRWTGVLQQLLGDGYYVIEEGLGSRTTDADCDHQGHQIHASRQSLHQLRPLALGRTKIHRERLAAHVIVL